MAMPVRIPDIGGTVESVVLIAWLKEVGQPVKCGEPICEVETDKSIVELESDAEGVLLQQVVPPDSEIQTDTIIAYVGLAGESLPQEQPTTEAAEVPATEELVAERASNRPQAVALSRDQLAVARRVVRSIREIPAIDLVSEVDMSAANKVRQESRGQSTDRISYDALYVHAVSRIIKGFPGFLGHVRDEQFIAHTSVDICVAIGVESKLYTPAVRNADSLSLAEIDRAIRGFVEKAGRAKLSPEDMEGGLLTVSNLGMYMVQSFNVIIPPEQSAALAIGQIEQCARVVDGQIVVRPTATVVLSVDHRAINGRVAAEFLTRLREFLEAL